MGGHQASPPRLRPTRPPGGMAGVTLKLAWLPEGGLEQHEWVAVGHRFSTISRRSQWWIGDWIRYGVAAWGESYAEAARITGYDTGTLRNMAWVASEFDLSLRSDRLSWSHHALLAPLSIEEKREWLARAVDDGLSVADLRAELRRAQEKPDAALAAEAPAEEATCPHCGRQVSAS